MTHQPEKHDGDILVITAFGAETAAVRRAIARQAEPARYAVVQAGVGEDKARTRLQAFLDRRKEAPVFAFLFGVAGGVNPKLRVGAVVIPDRLIALDDKGNVRGRMPVADVTRLQETLAGVSSWGIGVTVPRVYERDDKQWLLQWEPEVVLVDMESFAIAGVLATQDIPFLVCRTISDVVGQALPDDVYIQRWLKYGRMRKCFALAVRPVTAWRLYLLRRTLWCAVRSLEEASVFLLARVNDFIA